MGGGYGGFFLNPWAKKFFFKIIFFSIDNFEKKAGNPPPHKCDIRNLEYFCYLHHYRLGGGLFDFFLTFLIS